MLLYLLHKQLNLNYNSKHRDIMESETRENGNIHRWRLDDSTRANANM